MKHPSTRRLFEYWQDIRGARQAPERGDIEPGPIRQILSDTLILGCERDYRFRIAGTRICAAFGHELRGKSFLELWGSDSRAEVQQLLDNVASECIGVVANASALNRDGCKLEFEWLALPLSQRLARDPRILGVLAPTETPYWIGISALQRLTLGSFRYLQSDDRTDRAPQLGSPAVVRIRRGLVVYEGGRRQGC